MSVCQRLLCFAVKEPRGSVRTKLVSGEPVFCFGSVLGELRRDVKQPDGNLCKPSLVAGEEVLPREGPACPGQRRYREVLAA